MTDTVLMERLGHALTGRYTIERELGGGGMSQVFLASETDLDRQVVIKVLPADLMAGINIERFRREIQVAAQLQQANVVPVLAAGAADGIPYYVMPFISGRSLRERLNAGPMPIAEVITILRDVTRALAAAHAANIVHRDIKPENILLSGGTAVVADFGIARAITAARGGPHATDERLTRAGTSVGTPAYMAPEQAAGDLDADARADLYSLGAVAWEMLAGAPVFPTRSAADQVIAHMTKAPPPISSQRRDTPAPLASVVMDCLAKAPADRPPSAHAILDRLDSITAGESRPRSLAIYAGAVVATVVIARAAISLIGLPEWLFPAAIVVLALGLPAVLFLSTRQALRGGVAGMAALVIATGGYMGLRALGIGPAGTLFAKGALKPQDRIVFTRFRSGPADSTVASALTEALRSGLSESHAISLATDDDIGDATRLMRIPPGTRLDLPVQRDLAQRLGAPAVVDASVSGVGAGFLVTVRLVAAATGGELASFHKAVDGPAGLINAVDDIARSLRAKVGESLRQVHATPPLIEETTSSLVALQQLSAAFTLDAEGKFDEAAARLHDAIVHDSLFGMAWSTLAVIERERGHFVAQDSASEQAYALRDHMTEKERLWVTGQHFGFPRQRDPLKAIAAYQELVDHGDSGGAMANLATLRLNQRNYAEAAPLFQANLRRSPSPLARLSYAAALFNLGRPAETQAQIDSARIMAPNFPLVRQWSGELAYQKGDLPALRALADSAFHGSAPQPRLWGARRLMGLAMLQGKLAEFTHYFGEVEKIDVMLGNGTDAIGDSILLAYRDVAFGADPAPAIVRLDALLKTPRLDTLLNEEDYDLAAIVYATAGHPDHARQVFRLYDAIKWDSVSHRLLAPAHRRASAEILLAEKKWGEAIAEFRKADTTVTGFPAGTCRTCLYANLGRAFDQAGMRDSAIDNFERFVNTPYFLRLGSTNVIALDDSWSLPLILRRLGELHEDRGDRDAAAKYYRRFVDLWKDADPSLQPVVTSIIGRLRALGSEAAAR